MLKITNLLTQDEIAQYQQALDEANWQDGKATAGHLAKEVKKNLQLPENSSLARELGDYILIKLSQSEQFKSFALPAKTYPPMFNCYQNNGYFGSHVDNGIRKVPGASVQLRSDLSATLFLSSPENYEGGELVINCEFNQTSIKMNAGDLIIYPANTVHEVLPVTQGKRYAAIFWVQSLIKQSNKRNLLYDLDKSIQALSTQQVNKKELITLTDIYHNLLREWAEI